MQCSCGGNTAPRTHPKIVKGQIIGELEYERCTACGRIGDLTRKAMVGGEMTVVEQGSPGSIKWGR